jgi:hypothetical protein
LSIVTSPNQVSPLLKRPLCKPLWGLVIEVL